MTAGELQYRVDVYQRTRTGTSATGQGVFTERIIYTGVPCKIEPTAGRPLEFGRQQTTLATHVITMHQLDINEANWLVYCGQRFDIGYINKFADWMTIYASEVSHA